MNLSAWRCGPERLVLVPVGPEYAADLVRLHRDPWAVYWYGGEWGQEEAAGFASSCAGEILARGLVNDRDGESDNAPFAVYRTTERGITA